MELLRKCRKAILPCMTPLLCIFGLVGCGRDAPEGMRSQLSMPDSTVQKEEHTGVRVSAQGMIYIPYAMIDAVFLEYSDNVILPEEGGALYTFWDEHTENPRRNITAVYTNDVPQVREDQTSVPGRYVVLQLERMENPTPEIPGAWSLSTTAGIAAEIKGSASVRRLDFSDITIEQHFDAKNRQGQILQETGNLPPLLEENLFWPELKGFTVGQEWKSSKGLIHYSFYLPEGYDGTKSYPLVITLPGYNGMWLSDSEQTRGVNLIADRGAVAWTQQGEDVIVVAPQFTDWGNTAARQAIALTEHFIENYSVDQDRIYAAGFSAGGEIMSRAMGMRADLFAAFLHYGSRWSGEYDAVVKNRLPVCIYMMEDDEYYGSERAREAYNVLCSRYREEGLAEEEIKELVSLHIPDREFLSRWGFADFYMGGHIGGQMAVNDQTVMDWIMKQSK